MILIDLAEIICDNNAAIEWCMEIELISTSKLCPTCSKDMRFVDSDNTKDGKTWLCSSRPCKNKKISIRADSFFSKSKLSLSTIILFVYLWSRDYNLPQTKIECGISHDVALDWAKYCRSVALAFFQDRDLEKIGGEGLIVELDETVVAKRKYNRGRLIKETWVFGGILRSQDSFKCFMQVVDKRDEATLLPIVQNKVHPGTTIVTDGWAAYRNLSQYGYVHKVVIHSENFVNPNDSLAHTQNIENTWMLVKRLLHAKGTNIKSNMDEYLAEFLFRKRFFNTFESFIDQVKLNYNV
jgi:transposase-like protein/ssDNA-binding Zn-finger/Zn-ribbon topoisomerase 1